MALVAALAGTPLPRDTNSTPVVDAPTPGAATYITTGVASANHALPVDANGKSYRAVMLSCTAACWAAFASSGTDTVAASTSPAFVMAPGFPIVVGIPAGATNMAAIEVSAAGVLSISGVL